MLPGVFRVKGDVQQMGEPVTGFLDLAFGEKRRLQHQLLVYGLPFFDSVGRPRGFSAVFSPIVRTSFDDFLDFFLGEPVEKAGDIAEAPLRYLVTFSLAIFVRFSSAIFATAACPSLDQPKEGQQRSRAVAAARNVLFIFKRFSRIYS